MTTEHLSTYRIENFTATIAMEQAGMRLDQAMAQLFSDFSRSRLQLAIKNKQVLLDGKVCKGKIKVQGGEKISLEMIHQPHDKVEAQAIPLDIIYEDDFILVVNKPTKLVVHPAAGNPDGTLQNALLHHQADLARLPRAGIVHRLDKDTTGLLVVAKTEKSHKGLVQQLQQRTVKREYRAICAGVLTAGGTINAPIARHPKQRIKMFVDRQGKEAITHYRVLDRYRAHSLLKVYLETGRTHQIRVHLSKNRHPLIGDSLYGGRLKLPKGATPELQQILKSFPRQALHAYQLTLIHPHTEEEMSWKAPIPQDMQQLINILENDRP